MPTDAVVEVPSGLAQAIHDYLASKPMREVEGMVNALRQCKPKDEGHE